MTKCIVCASTNVKVTDTNVATKTACLDCKAVVIVTKKDVQPIGQQQ